MEEIARGIVRGDWNEIRATYSPTYIDYEKLRGIIADALRQREREVAEIAAAIAEAMLRQNGEALDLTALRTSIASAIRNRFMQGT